MTRLLILMLFLSINASIAYSLPTNDLDASPSIMLDISDDVVGDAINALNERITLTTAQTKQIREIGAEYNFSAASGSTLKQMNRAFRKRIRNEVLTAEQKQILRETRTRTRD